MEQSLQLSSLQSDTQNQQIKLLIVSIRCQMSLLNMRTTKKNQEFIQKMNRQYDRRKSSSCMAQYKKPNIAQNCIQENPQNQTYSNPIYEQTVKIEKTWQIAQKNIQNLMKTFLIDLQKKLEGIQQQNKFYKVLNFLRKNQFFWQISNMINNKLIKQNQRLNKQLEKNRFLAQQLKKQHVLNDRKMQNDIPENKIKIDPMRSLEENIYFKAKIMKQSQFIPWCRQLVMKNKIIIKQMSKRNQFQKLCSKLSDKNFENHLDSQFNSTSCPKQFGEFNQVIESINQITLDLDQLQFETRKNLIIKDIKDISEMKYKCKNPCCNFIQGNSEVNLMKKSMTEFLSKSRAQKGQKNIYRDRRQEQYFNRYYKRPSFNLKDVISVQQTKGDQVMRLQKQYLKMVQFRNKNKPKHKFQ